MALEDAIAEQIEKLEKEVGSVEEVVEETPDETPEVEDEDEKDFKDPAVLKEAKNLYKLLKDKETRGLVLRTLAEKEGILKEPVETKQDVTAARKDVKTILKEKLGDKFDFLIPQLSEALDEMLTQVRDENRASLETVTTKVDISQVETQTVNAVNKLAKELGTTYEKFDKSPIMAKMAALSHQYLGGPGLSADQYIRSLYTLATGKAPGTNPQKTVDRINRNAKDVPSRMRSSSGAGIEKLTTRDRPKMNLNDAVKTAMQEMKLEE